MFWIKLKSEATAARLPKRPRFTSNDRRPPPSTGGRLPPCDRGSFFLFCFCNWKTPRRCSDSRPARQNTRKHSRTSQSRISVWRGTLERAENSVCVLRVSSSCFVFLNPSHYWSLKPPCESACVCAHNFSLIIILSWFHVCTELNMRHVMLEYFLFFCMCAITSDI